MGEMAGHIKRLAVWAVALMIGFTLVHLAALWTMPKPLDYVSMLAFVVFFVCIIRTTDMVLSKLKKQNPPRC